MDAIYARQSIDKKDSLSIEAQIEQCKRCAGEDALVFQDKGFSGKNTKRPAFQALMSAVEAGSVKKLYVYRLDRFSRSIADFSQLWSVLDKHGVEFNSVTENFDTSSIIGRAVLNIIMVFAQLERETTAERVRDNYNHRFSLGAWPGGPAPYGFELTKIENDGRRVSSLISNESAQVVKKIFEEYAEPDMTLRGLARKLTAEGIHGPKREAWDNVTLSRLLHSPLYVRADEDVYLHYLAMGMTIEQPLEAFDGIHACNVIGRRNRSQNKYNTLSSQKLAVANHEGIVDAALWLRVQNKLAGNVQIPNGSAGKYSWLTGLLKCVRCGYSVKINKLPNGRLVLRCSGRSNLAVCKADISLDIRELEAYVSGEITRVLKDSPPGEMDVDSGDSAMAVLELDRKIENLVNALSVAGAGSAGYITAKIDKLHAQREKMLADAVPKHRPVKPIDFGSLRFEEKKLIATEFIERIELEGDSANIKWKL